jgi:signal transduction histidine kinase
LLELITAVLDLSRLEAGRLPLVTQETQVAALLQEIQAELRPLHEQSPLAFVWDVEPGLPALSTDAGKLKVVLKNLIRNAVKFTPAGSITVAARSRPGGVELRVSDTGRGIPPEALEVIFEPFHQLEPASTPQLGGTGLGLHIVKRVLELVGGTVRVESTVGEGSTFRVWLPLKSPSPRSLPREAAKQAGSDEPNSTSGSRPALPPSPTRGHGAAGSARGSGERTGL